MPRSARQKSESGVYHIMVRGINRQDIFHDDEDRLRYLTTLDRFTRQGKLTVFGFCLMDNHVHVLLAEGDEPLGETMRRLGTSYVFWYNNKYTRVGHLFQDRFRSEPVESDDHLLAVLRYIHQNPVKANLTESCDYRWSSYGNYTGVDMVLPGLVDTREAAGLLGSTQHFVEFTNSPGRVDLCAFDRPPNQLVDSVVAGHLSTLLANIGLDALQDASLVDRTLIIRQLRSLQGSSVRQIARVTGLSKSTIANA